MPGSPRCNSIQKPEVRWQKSDRQLNLLTSDFGHRPPFVRVDAIRRSAVRRRDADDRLRDLSLHLAFLKFEARCAYRCADPKRNCYLRKRAQEEQDKVRAELAKKPARKTR